MSTPLSAKFPQDFSAYDATRIPDDFFVRSGKHGHHWAEYTKPIEKSENDKRDYKLIRLDNGVRSDLALPLIQSLICMLSRRWRSCSFPTPKPTKRLLV